MMWVRVVAVEIGGEMRTSKEGDAPIRGGADKVRWGLLLGASLGAMDSLSNPERSHKGLLCPQTAADADCYFVRTEDALRALGESFPEAAAWLKVAVKPDEFPFLAVLRTDCEVL